MRNLTAGVYVAAVVFFILLFAYVKNYGFLEPLLPRNLLPEILIPQVQVIGLSYMLFKFIHMAVDQNQGQLEPVNFFSYANYQLSFFTLAAGPIQRFNDFRQTWARMDLGPSDVRGDLTNWARILLGMIKMGAIAPILLQWFEDAKNHCSSPATFIFTVISRSFSTHTTSTSILTSPATRTSW